MKKCIIDDFGYTGEYQKKLLLLKNCGFDSVFLNMRNNKKPIDKAEIISKLTSCAEMKMEILFAHLPIDNRINNLWYGFDEAYFNEIIGLIDIISAYGITDFVIHSYYKDIHTILNKNILNFFIALKRHYADKAIKIYIENVDYFYQDKYVFENLSGEYEFCFDIGHYNCFYDELQKEYFLKNVIHNAGFKISALHLHDNNGITDEHKIPFSQGCNTDFAVLKEIKNISSLPLVLECKMEKTDSEETARQFLISACESIDKLSSILK